MSTKPMWCECNEMDTDHMPTDHVPQWFRVSGQSVKELRELHDTMLHSPLEAVRAYADDLADAIGDLL